MAKKSKMITRTNKVVKKPSLRKSTLFILALSLILAIGIAIWKSSFLPVPVDIMAITTPLIYGETTLEGYIREDSSVDYDSYLLVLPDMQVITLDLASFPESLLNQRVIVSGTLTPPKPNFLTPFLTVSSVSIITQNQ